MPSCDFHYNNVGSDEQSSLALFSSGAGGPAAGLRRLFQRSAVKPFLVLPHVQDLAFRIGTRGTADRGRLMFFQGRILHDEASGHGAA